MGKKVSIKEIAERCNVSIATVSYVLNGVNKVSDEKKAEILQAIEELGYKRNLNAVALSKKESKLICLLLPLVESEDRLESIMRANPFYMEFLSGAESVAKELGYDIILAGTKSDADFQGWLESRSIDGVIAFDTISDESIEVIKKLGIPCCLVDTPKVDGFVSVNIDDEGGEYQACQYLIRCGHREIAFAGASLDKSMVNISRYKGYLKALEEAGIKPNKDWIFQEEVSYEGGKRLASRIVDLEKPVTAVVCTSDILALGLMKGFDELHKKVPDDYSVIGFDDIQIASYLTPSITTVRQDIYKKGSLSVDALVRKLKNESPEDVILETSLIVRDSVVKRG